MPDKIINSIIITANILLDSCIKNTPEKIIGKRKFFNRCYCVEVYGALQKTFIFTIAENIIPAYGWTL